MVCHFYLFVFAEFVNVSKRRYRRFYQNPHIFETQTTREMLGLVSLTGNLFTDDHKRLCHHTVFCF